MNREEMVSLRKETFERLARMRKVGDYGAGASDIRENCEVLVKLIDHHLERLK